MRDGGKPLHLHIENVSRLGDVFEVTPERLDAARDRHPDVASKLKVTVGRDGDIYADAMKTAEVLFGWQFEREALGRLAPALRLIQVQGAGINHLLPLDWLPPGVVLTNSSGAHGRRASEYLIMAVLALNNGLPHLVTSQQKSRWAPVTNTSIAGKTLLIFGVGHVGGDTARLAKVFGLRVLGVRRTGEPHGDVDEMYRPEDLPDLLPRADFIINTAPHTPSTNRVFGAAEFARMKDGAGFVNYSRAQLVDYEALRAELDSGRISAVVDVFDEEPLPSASPLWQTPNLIITPHCSSNDPVNHAPRSLDLLFENIGRLLRDEPLENVVDPSEQY